MKEEGNTASNSKKLETQGDGTFMNNRVKVVKVVKITYLTLTRFQSGPGLKNTEAINNNLLT